MIPTILTIALAVAAPAPKADPTQPPAIAGEWVAEKSVVGGRDRDVPAGFLRFTFTPDGRFLVKEGAADAKQEGTYKVDTAKDPAAIDILPAESKKLPPVPGIYKLTGDTLTLCLSRDAGGGRPATFESPARSRVSLLTLKRAKPKD